MLTLTSSLSGKHKIFWIFFLAALVPSQLHAQAGSFPAISLESSGNSLRSLMESDTEGSSRAQVINSPQRPKGVLKMAENDRYLLWVELKRGRLHVMERQNDGGLLTKKIIPVSIGKNGYGKEAEGDKLTPIGVYRLTSFLADNTLDDFYGNGAYPLNYPNAYDRLMKRTGHGIWLHGLPKGKDQRPLLDSDGCVVVDNMTLNDLADFVSTGTTYIVLSEDDIEWAPTEGMQQREQNLAQTFEHWRSDWESKNNKAYLSYYADSFSDLTQDKKQWSTYKSRVNDAKKFIEVETSNISFIADPRDPALVTARFYQAYDSSNYNWTGWKEQLWKETEKGWQIVYEGNG